MLDRKHKGDSRGVALIITLLSVVIFGFLAVMVIDFGFAQVRATRVLTAADAAALAGTMTLQRRSGDPNNRPTTITSGSPLETESLAANQAWREAKLSALAALEENGFGPENETWQGVTEPDSLPEEIRELWVQDYSAKNVDISELYPPNLATNVFPTVNGFVVIERGVYAKNCSYEINIGPVVRYRFYSLEPSEEDVSLTSATNMTRIKDFSAGLPSDSATAGTNTNCLSCVDNSSCQILDAVNAVRVIIFEVYNPLFAQALGMPNLVQHLLRESVAAMAGYEDQTCWVCPPGMTATE